ncbi:MAG: patatin-like phospholipase family protein, partial [Bdellovibrionota bacterium]
MFKNISIYTLPFNEFFSNLFESLKINDYLLISQIPSQNISQKNYVLSANSYEFIMNHKKIKQNDFNCVHKLTLEGDELKKCEDRIILNTIGSLCESPSSGALQEILVYLFVNQELCVEYLGRGLLDKKESLQYEKTFPEGQNVKFYCDKIGGYRKYCWKTHPAQYVSNAPLLQDQLKGFLNWISDPEAKVVLSLGAGGVRFLGATSLLKVLDIFNGRKHIQEIWGCSGGSILGYFYSIGLKAEDIEKLSYDYYHSKLTTYKLKAQEIFSFFVQRIIKGHSYSRGLTNPEPILKGILNASEKHNTTHQNKIPFFSIASDVYSHSPIVLETHGTDHTHHSFIKAEKPIDALLGSCAIPYLIPSLNPKNKIYWDGVMSEETPLLLPIQKWHDDRKKGLTTQKKLKIIYIQLAPRFQTEAKNNFLSKLFPIKEMTEIVDCFFETRAKLKLNFVQNLPDVEILNIPLEINKIAFITRKEIPYLIKKGK